MKNKDDDDGVCIRAYIYRPYFGLPSKVYTDLCFGKNGKTLQDDLDRLADDKNIMLSLKKDAIMENDFKKRNRYRLKEY